MKYLKRALLWGVKYGLPIGLAISYTITVIFAGIYGGSQPFNEMLRYYLVGGIFGFFCSSLPVIYTITEWSTLRQTVVHFILMVALTLPCALIGRWIPFRASVIAEFLIIFVLIYLCYWFCFYFYWKARIKKINSAIKNRK